MLPANRLRAFYFVYFSAIGAFMPYFTPYLRGLGFSGNEIGTVQMIGPLVIGPAAIAWSSVADRIGKPVTILRIAALWAFVSVFFLPWAGTPLTVAAVLFAQGLGASAILPLVDSISMEWVKTQPGSSYAHLRPFGSIGYIVATVILGIILAFRHNRPADPAVPIAIVFCVGAYALTAWQIPLGPSLGKRPGLSEMAGLLRDRNLVLFLVFAMVHWIGCAPFNVFLGIHVRDLGLSPTITGVAMGVGVAAETVVLVLYPRIETRFSMRALFSILYAATIVRWLLTWQITSGFWLIAAQLIHGLSFGVFWAASIRTMGALVPSHLRATGQALYMTIVIAGGNAIGYQLSGRGYQFYGAIAPLFAWAAVLETVVLFGSFLPVFSRLISMAVSKDPDSNETLG